MVYIIISNIIWFRQWTKIGLFNVYGKNVLFLLEEQLNKSTLSQIFKSFFI